MATNNTAGAAAQAPTTPLSVPGPTPTVFRGAKEATQQGADAALANQRALGGNQLSTGLNVDR